MSIIKQCECGEKEHLRISEFSKYIGNSITKYHQAWCCFCGKEGPEMNTEQEAINAWNESRK